MNHLHIFLSIQLFHVFLNKNIRTSVLMDFWRGIKKNIKYDCIRRAKFEPNWKSTKAHLQFKIKYFSTITWIKKSYILFIAFLINNNCYIFRNGRVTQKIFVEAFFNGQFKNVHALYLLIKFAMFIWINALLFNANNEYSVIIYCFAYNYVF